MAVNFLTNVNLNKNYLLGAAVENLGAAPATPVTGQMYFDTTDVTLKVWDGSVWQTVGSENFLESSSFNTTTKVLTLTLTNGDTVAIDLSDLEELYALAVTDGDTVDLTLTGDGSAGDPWTITAAVILSTDAGNALTVGSDSALYVPTPAFTVSDGGTSQTITDGDTLTFLDGNTVDFTVQATDTITAEVKISGDVGNKLTTGTDNALFVPTTSVSITDGATTEALADGGTITFADTGTIDMVVAATDTVSAAIKFSSDAGNIAAVGTDNALYVSEQKFIVTDGTTPQTINADGDTITLTDTATIDWVTSATGVVEADVKISATAGNDLVANADGLYITATQKYTAAAVSVGTTPGIQTVTHNLGTTDVIVQVYNASNQQVFLDVAIVDANSITVRANGSTQNVKVVVVG